MKDEIIINLYSDFYNNFYNEATDSEVEIDDYKLNSIGWQNSFTKQNIPKSEMQEWRDLTINNLLEKKNNRILEVGCGTGMILFGLLPFCDRYVGVDFAEAAINFIRGHLNEDDNVELYVASATEVKNLNIGLVDLALVNSAIQYMGSEKNISEIVEIIIDKVDKNGCVFLGDLKRKYLKTEFYEIIERFENGPSLPEKELMLKVEKRRRDDLETYLEQPFFEALKKRISRIKKVEYRLRKGIALNEMMVFRYDVFLYLDSYNEANYITYTCDATTTKEQIDSYINKNKKSNIRIQYIYNKRLEYYITNILNRELYLDTVSLNPAEFVIWEKNFKYVTILQNENESIYHYDVLLKHE